LFTEFHEAATQSRSAAINGPMMSVCPIWNLDLPAKLAAARADVRPDWQSAEVYA